MNTWKIVLATVVIFGTGVVTGGLLVTHAQRADTQHMRFTPGVGPMEAWRPRATELLRSGQQNARRLVDQPRLEFLRNVQRQLRLAPEQRARIEQIVREGQEKTREITEGIRPKLREHWAEVNQRIRAELTPAQRERFDELIKHRPWAHRGPEPGESPRPRGPRPVPDQDRSLPPMREPTGPAERLP